MSKVVLLAPTPPPAGGIAGWTARMMDAHLKNGWQVEVVDEKSIGGREVFGKSSRKKLTVEWKRCCQIWKGLRNALQDPEAKVVHSCIPSFVPSMIREYVCACITKSKKRKFIIHFRCTVPNSVKSKLSRFLLRRLCNKSDMIFSLNEQTSAFLRELTHTPIRLIPNFISEAELADAHRIAPELKRVLYVGGLVEDKGIRDVLRIARRLPDMQFVLVGKGNREYEDCAKAQNLTNVVFTGGKDRAGVKEELAKADVFLFMTYFRGEGFSNALCEAMAAGLPCVATDWAANQDMIGADGGAVVKVGDVDAAVAALEAMRSADVRSAMSERNLKKVREQYVQSVVVDQYVDAYESLAGECAHTE